jgi:hypothetical protein
VACEDQHAVNGRIAYAEVRVWQGFDRTADQRVVKQIGKIEQQPAVDRSAAGDERRAEQGGEIGWRNGKRSRPDWEVHAGRCMARRDVDAAGVKAKTGRTAQRAGDRSADLAFRVVAHTASLAVRRWSVNRSACQKCKFLRTPAINSRFL